MKFNLKFILTIFLLFFITNIFILQFYNWLLKFNYNYYFNYSYYKLHYLIDIIYNFNNIENYILFKLNNININNEFIDYIILIKFIENKFGIFYSYQFYYTLNFLLEDIKIEIFNF